MKYAADLYDREVIFKTAYFFTDVAFVHLDLEDGNFVVELHGKNEAMDELELEKRFENELISQQTRKLVADRTGEIRKLIVARSLASTIVEHNDIKESEPHFLAEDILKDWFEEHDE